MPEALLGAWYGRVGLKIAWTGTNVGLEAKKCAESGPSGWKAAKPLPAEPGAAAGFFVARLKSRNPVIPAVANRLVLFDFDRAEMGELLERHGLVLPAGAWLVKTPNGMHAYLAAPEGRPGIKVEVTAERVTVSSDGYLIGPGGRHPDGGRYELVNVDVGAGW
jgi:hypothetical protein